jgi:UDPglucose--hexose-1-phosphate uridylyltransferase
VVHVPRHARSIAELDEGELTLVAQAWRARREEQPAGYLHALVNEGRVAGASLPHSHSQLVWLAETPPLVAAERREALAEVLPLVVDERDGVVAAVHPAGASPYEAVIAPCEPESDAFSSAGLAGALVLLATLVRRLHELEGAMPFNAWLHDGPYWHFHLVPRLTTPAAIELGAGIYVNTLAPEEAAERLRGPA